MNKFTKILYKNLLIKQQYHHYLRLFPVRYLRQNRIDKINKIENKSIVKNKKLLKKEKYDKSDLVTSFTIVTSVLTTIFLLRFT
jgi:hypothetical protein